MSESGLMADAIIVPSEGEWGLTAPYIDGYYTGVSGIPEGAHCWYTKNGPESYAYAGWGVFVAVYNGQIDPTATHYIDLSAASSLEFYVKSPVNLAVQIQSWNTQTDAAGAKSSQVWISNYGWTNNGGWEKITIPKSAFINVDFQHIWCPFMIFTAGNSPNVEWYVDWVQWITQNENVSTQNDADSGNDAGNTFDMALAISAGYYTGYIDSTDTDDYYKVNLIAGQTISVSMTPPTGSDFDLSLYDASQWEVDSSLLGGSQTDMVSYTATSSGYHYIRVYLYEGSGIYSMTVTVAGGATQNDMGTGGDAGNYLSNATAILAGSGTGYIDSTDTDDYYKVNLIAGQTISVSMT
ncbi:MAG: PPC domain-containing protein, partial [Candidatus Hadarchaeales archaeon]